MMMMTNVAARSVPIIYAAKKGDFTLNSLIPLLADEEKAKLDRFRQPADKERHALAHSLKRVVISQYMSCSPHELSFSQASYGKPFCLNSQSPCFNLSHSKDWVVLALSAESEVGVDIEFTRELDINGIVHRISSEREMDVFRNSDSPHQCFLNFWTQKEAISKACGQGISVGLSSIPCSGETGVYPSSFLGVDYTSYTYGFPDEGVLSYASAIQSPPEIRRIISITDGSAGKKFESIVFDL
jgi:4'-phosphopantetheinyl transferase